MICTLGSAHPLTFYHAQGTFAEERHEARGLPEGSLTAFIFPTGSDLCNKTSQRLCLTAKICLSTPHPLNGSQNLPPRATAHSKPPSSIRAALVAFL